MSFVADPCEGASCTGQCIKKGVCDPSSGRCTTIFLDNGSACFDDQGIPGVCLDGSCVTAFIRITTASHVNRDTPICPAGYGGATCQPCVPGTYSRGGSVINPHPACVACAPGLWSVAGASVCTDLCADMNCSPKQPCQLHAACNATTGTCGTFPNAPDNAVCILPTHGLGTMGTCRNGSCVAMCPPGKGGRGCQACALGYYSLGGNLTKPRPDCTSCPHGNTTAIMGATTRGACTVAICEAGHGGHGCALCRRGFFSAGGSASDPKPACSPCDRDNHRTTTSTGSMSAASCTVNICAAGHGGSGCDVCPKGMYSEGGSPSVPRPKCTACPAGQTTRNKGAASVTNCSVTVCHGGRGGPDCQLCLAGQYSAGGNATHPQPLCMPCTSGRTRNNAVGVTSPADCV